MDTLTHTLVGLVLGECAARTIPSSHSGLQLEQRRGLYIGLLMVGSNLPDSDFLYSLITGSKLDYLLQHRGHSHTVVGVIAEATLLFAAGWTWLRYAQWQAQRKDLAWLAAWALIGPVLHVTMDSTNTYGVHPFWPFSSRWWYGDAVFIIEPLLWVAAVPVLGLVQRNALRLLLTVVVIAALALLFSSQLIPVPLRVLIVLGVLAGLLLGHGGSPRAVLTYAVTGWSAVTVMFLVAHGVAERTVTHFVVANDPAAVTLDRILTPLPANPLCWEVILVQLHAEQYNLRRATLALAPQWLPVTDCPNRDLETQTSAPLHAVHAGDTDQWEWFGEWQAPRAQLSRLVAKSCEAKAFVRFARAPWWSSVGSKMWLGDLRYDREPQAGFAEIELHDACPWYVPPWEPPRRDLLSQAADSTSN